MAGFCPLDGCIGCDQAAGRVPLPGGRIHETSRWIDEPYAGPLGLRTLTVRPTRHLVHVWDLNNAQAKEA